MFARHHSPVARRSTDVRELILRTVSICRATFDRIVDIEVSGDASIPSVVGEASQLEQVLLNICLNARDALESSGRHDPRIRIALDVAPGADADQQATDWVRLRISDNGPGMTDHVRGRIFEPFFTTKEVGRGSGLGLATAYAITEDHGGRLLCDSQLGIGTTFTVLLPSAPEAASEARALVRQQPGGTERILVIDDEHLVRSAVRSILEPMGYTVREAADAPSGFELFRRERDQLDLVLLDLSLPGISGDSVLSSMLRERPGMRIVLLTGYRPLIAPEGAAAVVQKPFEVEELLRVVREVCDGGGPSQSPTRGPAPATT